MRLVTLFCPLDRTGMVRWHTTRIVGEHAGLTLHVDVKTEDGADWSHLEAVACLRRYRRLVGR